METKRKRDEFDEPYYGPKTVVQRTRIQPKRHEAALEYKVESADAEICYIFTVEMQTKLKGLMCMSSSIDWDIYIYDKPMTLGYITGEMDGMYYILEENLDKPIVAFIPKDSIISPNGIKRICELEKKSIVLRIATPNHATIGILFPVIKRLEIFNPSGANSELDMFTPWILRQLSIDIPSDKPTKFDKSWEVVRIYPDTENQEKYEDPNNVLQYINYLQVRDDYCQTWIWYYTYMRIVKKCSPSQIFEAVGFLSR